jgi:hypothetical protein
MYDCFGLCNVLTFKRLFCEDFNGGFLLNWGSGGNLGGAGGGRPKCRIFGIFYLKEG